MADVVIKLKDGEIRKRYEIQRKFPQQSLNGKEAAMKIHLTNVFFGNQMR